jgi:hypothetical protein
LPFFESVAQRNGEVQIPADELRAAVACGRTRRRD